VKKVLIVDDEDSYRMTIGSQLKLKGWAVIEAEDGMMGLELAQEHKPNVIISDVQMPNMNGFMMVEALKQEPATANIPIIMMTSAAQAAGAWQSDMASGYIEKPFTLAKLLELMNTVVK